MTDITTLTPATLTTLNSDELTAIRKLAQRDHLIIENASHVSDSQHRLSQKLRSISMAAETILKARADGVLVEAK